MRAVVTIGLAVFLLFMFVGLLPILALGVIPVILVYMCVRAVQSRDLRWLYQGVFAIVTLIVFSALFGGFLGPLLACIAAVALLTWAVSGGDVKPLFPTGAKPESEEKEPEDV